MRAAVRQTWGQIEPSCKNCRRPGNEFLRQEWGCDAPSTVPAGGVYFITCPRCDGTAEECKSCEGSGRYWVPRCPSALADRRVIDAIESYVMLTNHGTYPAPGGRFAQTAGFHRLVGVISAEKAATEKQNPRKGKGK